MRKPLLIASALVLLVAITSIDVQATQTRRVSGTVTDAETGKPIEGVKVVAYMRDQPNTKFNATTDGKGHYAINGLIPGAAVFEFEKEGYEPFRTPTRLSSTAIRIKMDAELAPIKRQAGTASPEIREKYDQASALFQDGKAEEALAVYEELAAGYPDLYMINTNIGIIKRSLGQFDEAIDHFKLVLEKEPDNFTVLIHIAETYLNQQKFKEAVEWYIQAANAKPDDFYVLNQIADVARFMEDYDLAIEYYDKAIAVDASNPMTHLYLGTLLDFKKDYARAYDHLAAYIKLDPAGVAVPNAKALIDDVISNFDGIEAHLAATVAADDSDALAHCVLGKVLAFAQKNDEAKTHLQRYLELDANDSFGETSAVQELLSAL